MVAKAQTPEEPEPEEPPAEPAPDETPVSPAEDQERRIARAEQNLEDAQQG
jgi:hypothetical protein